MCLFREASGGARRGGRDSYSPRSRLFESVGAFGFCVSREGRLAAVTGQSGVRENAI